MFLEYLTSALVTLLVTLDPPGLAPIFLSLTRGMTNDERRQVGDASEFRQGPEYPVAGTHLSGCVAMLAPQFGLAGLVAEAHWSSFR